MDVAGLQTELVEPFRVLMTQIGIFVIRLLGALLIFFLGRLVGKAIQQVLVRVLKTFRMDDWAGKIGIGEFLSKGGIAFSLTELIGLLVYWMVMLVVLLTAFNAMGLFAASQFLEQVVAYLPQVIASIILMVLGFFFASFLSSATRAAASNAGLAQANMLGQLVHVVIIVFVSALALEQLQIGRGVIGFAFNIVLAAIGLGFAIAFGLGCKDLIGEMVTDFVDKMRSGK